MVGELRSVEVLQELANRSDQRGSDLIVGAEPVEHEGPSFVLGEHVTQEFTEVVDLHSPVAKRLREGVVLLLGLLRPEHVVEQEALDVRRCQPRELESRAVDDGLS